MLEPQQTALLGRLIDQVPLGADRGNHRGDDLLANGVQRRVCHLREELLEVVVQQLRTFGEHGEWSVIAHRSDRLQTIGRHRSQDDPQVLKRVAERALQLEQRFVQLAVRRGRFRDRVERALVLANPVAIRMLRGELMLDLVVGDNALLSRVDQEHASWSQAAFEFDFFGRNVEHARLGGHDHHALLGDPVTTGAQTIAVEQSAHQRAIREGHRGRSIPRLHQTGLILIVGLLLVRHALVAGPGLGNEH